MKTIFRRWYGKFKSRIQRRLDKKHHTSGERPAFTARNIDYDVSFRDRGMVYGGIGAIHLLVQELGLAKAIDEHLHVLKIHQPYLLIFFHTKNLIEFNQNFSRSFAWFAAYREAMHII